MSDIAINVKHLSKNFHLYHEKRASIFESIVGFFSRKQHYEIISVLDDISFDIKKGEMIGIIGKNGSGKTTLLRILSNIYKPDSGFVEVNGTIIPLLALGLGFHPELTAITNIVQSSTLLGIPKKDIVQKIDDILKFAELEKFADTKIKNFSSGMAMRLAFSTAVQVDPDILILDEVFAVGDLNFQKKCFDTIMSFKKRGKSIIFVSHDINPIRDFCDRAIFLNQGKIKAIGKPEHVISSYLSFLKLKKSPEKNPENNTINKEKNISRKSSPEKNPENNTINKEKNIPRKSSPIYWNDIISVTEYLNKLATDVAKISPLEDIVNRFSSKLPFTNVLLLGTHEFKTSKQILDLGISKQIDVVDSNLENITNSILQKNFLPINYFHKDYASIFKLNKKYDAIFCGSILNFIPDLDSFFKSLNLMLNQNGLIFVNDYVGPNQMNFSEVHVKFLEKINSEIPEYFRSSSTFNKLSDPNSRDMISHTKSIKEVFLKYFNLEFSRNLNGGIAYPILYKNVKKFDSLDGIKQLKKLLEQDQEHSEKKKVPILFWMGVGRHKK